MQELLQRLQSLHNLSPEQSKSILTTVKNFIVEKFPMAEGMIGNFLGGDADNKSGNSGGGSTGGGNDLTDKIGGMFK
jgi:hypothetical protein